MSKVKAGKHITYDYTWSQFAEMRQMNKMLDELHNELNRRNNKMIKKREQTEYEYDYELDDDD